MTEPGADATLFLVIEGLERDVPLERLLDIRFVFC
jgi:hypothetical protein